MIRELIEKLFNIKILHNQEYDLLIKMIKDAYPMIKNIEFK